MHLKGKVAIVTGANSGIGEATARALAERGMHLVPGARGPERLEAVTAKLVASGAGVGSISRGAFRVAGMSPGMVQTNFVAATRSHEATAAAAAKVAGIGLDPGAIGRAIVYAVEQPENVGIGDVVVHPSAQD